MNSNDYGEPSNKRKKLNEDEENEVVASSAEPQPDIFKLNVDCFEEILDYLDICDLSSFGQTCKRLQQVAGRWFRENYTSTGIRARSRAIFLHGAEGIEINHFSEFITNVRFFDDPNDNCIDSEEIESEDESEVGESDGSLQQDDSDDISGSGSDENDSDENGDNVEHVPRMMVFANDDDDSDNSYSPVDELDDINHLFCGGADGNDDYQADDEIDQYIESILSQALVYIRKDYYSLSFNRRRKIRDFTERYRFVQSNCSNAFIKEIEFIDCNITSTKIKCIESILNDVESVELSHCSLNGDLYQEVLQICNKMTHLHVIGNKGKPHIIGNNNHWLQRKYASLERFVFEWYGGRIIKLRQFFELNPNVRKFSTDIGCILTNLPFFLKSNVKLNTFAVFYDLSDYEGLVFICEILAKMYTRGFYKHLHFYFGENIEIDPVYAHLLASMNVLEKLYGKLSEQLALSAIVNLEELTIDDSTKVTDWEQLTGKLANLKRIELSHSSIQHITMLISNAAKLRGIMLNGTIERGTNFENDILDIFALNKERKKLENAQRVLIFVPEWIYIATKRALGQTERSLVQIKRVDSNDWFNDFTKYL